MYKARKVVSVEEPLAISLAVSALVGLYGHPGGLLKQAGGTKYLSIFLLCTASICQALCMQLISGWTTAAADIA
jgi:hypothetical protein